MTVCTNAVPIVGLRWRLRGLPGVAARFLFAGPAPVEAPSALVGDVAELLDVDVDQ